MIKNLVLSENYPKRPDWQHLTIPLSRCGTVNCCKLDTVSKFGKTCCTTWAINLRFFPCLISKAKVICSPNYLHCHTHFQRPTQLLKLVLTTLWMSTDTYLPTEQLGLTLTAITRQQELLGCAGAQFSIPKPTQLQDFLLS